MGRGTLPEVWDGSGDPPGGPRWIGKPCRRSGTGRGTPEKSGTGRRTLRKIRDGSGDPPKGPGWVGGPSRRSGTGLETFPDVRDVLGDPS